MDRQSTSSVIQGSIEVHRPGAYLQLVCSCSEARKMLSSEKSHLSIPQPKIRLLPRSTSHYPSSPPVTSKSVTHPCPNTKLHSHKQPRSRRVWHYGGRRQTNSKHGWCNDSNRTPISESSALPMFSAIYGRKDNRRLPHLLHRHRRYSTLFSSHLDILATRPHHHPQVCSLFFLWAPHLASALDSDRHRL